MDNKLLLSSWTGDCLHLANADFLESTLTHTLLMHFKGMHIHRQCTHTEDWDFRATCGPWTARCPLNFRWRSSQLSQISPEKPALCPRSSRFPQCLHSRQAGLGHAEMKITNLALKWESEVTSPGRGGTSPCAGPDSQPLPHSSPGDALAQWAGTTQRLNEDLRVFSIKTKQAELPL